VSRRTRVVLVYLGAVFASAFVLELLWPLGALGYLRGFALALGGAVSLIRYVEADQ
jgi:hypothetical protein